MAKKTLPTTYRSIESRKHERNSLVVSKPKLKADHAQGTIDNCYYGADGFLRKDLGEPRQTWDHKAACSVEKVEYLNLSLYNTK